MGAIMCGVPTPGDRAAVERFGQVLARSAGRPTLDGWFDADVHTLAPDVCNREDYVVIDGKLEVRRG